MRKLSTSISLMLVIAGCGSNLGDEGVTDDGALLSGTLQVGPSRQFHRVCDAIAAADPGSTIEVDAGTYMGDTCSISKAGLTIRGVGGRAKLDASGVQPAQRKAILVLDADNITLENIEFANAAISAADGGNAAGIRLDVSNINVTIRNSYFHDNQNGILGGAGGSLTIESSEFARNGVGNGCDVGGCTHNIYVGHLNKLTMRSSYSHDIASDTANKGHLLKSRAQQNFILYNRLTSEGGPDSYEAEFPNGGLVVLVGNQFEKGTRSGNGNVVGYAAEGLSNSDRRIFASFNTFVNDHGGGAFFNVNGGGTLTAHDNIFVGGGTGFSNVGGFPADNLSGQDPLFVNAGAFDYHLRAESPARGRAGDPGSADGFSLRPDTEYVQPLMGVARASTRDFGAFEYGTSTSGGSTSTGTGGTTTTQPAPAPAPAPAPPPSSTATSGSIVGLAGKCLDDNAGLTADGTKIQLWTCNGTGAQQWSYQNGSIVGPGGKCLDVQWGNSTSGTTVWLWTCNGTAAQKWSYQNGTLVGLGGKCLDVFGANTADGATIGIWDCHGGTNQQWSFR